MVLHSLPAESRRYGEQGGAIAIKLMNTETYSLNIIWLSMHGQTCSRTRIIGRLDCSTNKAPDMHWESSLGPLVASQQSLKRPGVLQEDTSSVGPE